MVGRVELVGCCACRAVLDPVVGDALRTVGDRDRAALSESERLKRATHRCVVLMGVAAQVVRMLRCKAENCPSDAVPARCRHTVNHVIIGIRTPRAVNLGVRLIRPWSEGEDSKRPLIVGYKEAAFARDVFFGVNASWISGSSELSVGDRVLVGGCG